MRELQRQGQRVLPPVLGAQEGRDANQGLPCAEPDLFFGLGDGGDGCTYRRMCVDMSLSLYICILYIDRHVILCKIDTHAI